MLTRLVTVTLLLPWCCGTTLAAPERSAINGPRSADRAPLPFSDAVRVGDTLYISGTIGIDPRTDRAAADPKVEATEVMGIAVRAHMR